MAMTSPIDMSRLGRGFGNAVLDSQTAFRTLMEALAGPGVARAIALAIDAPPGIAPATAVALLTLADFETPVYLAPAEAAGAAGDTIRFHAGARLVTDPSAAMFAVARAAAAAPLLARLAVGEDRYPDRSCTLFVEVPALSGGPRVRLTGPGIAQVLEIAPAGLDAAFWTAAMDNAALYPLGVDMVLVAGDTILGLPRSTHIALVEG